MASGYEARELFTGEKGTYGYMTMNIRVTDFSLRQISESGQCFRLTEDSDGSYSLVAYDRYLRLSQNGDMLTLSCDNDEWDNLWRVYFDMDTDYGAFRDAVDADDEYMRRACRLGRGIRILRQDPWETTVTFIISQRNNIPRIRGCVDRLCRLFGDEKINDLGGKYYTFPSSARLAGLDEAELGPCRLGYRAGYILESSRMIQDGTVDLESLRGLPCEQAMEELMRLHGVGKKVASCICLFGLHQLDAFPVDTHIEDVLREHYPEGFPYSKYRGFSGVLQQYAFYSEITENAPGNVQA